MDRAAGGLGTAAGMRFGAQRRGIVTRDQRVFVGASSWVEEIFAVASKKTSKLWRMTLIQPARAEKMRDEAESLNTPAPEI